MGVSRGRNMKISINSQFIKEPCGGGMQFANYLKGFLTKRDIKVVNHLKDSDIDIILHVSPFPFLNKTSCYSFFDAYIYKLRHPRTVIIHRVNECDERKGTNYMNSLLRKVSNYSDFTVFISSWLKPLINLPLNKFSTVILNGADNTIFNTIGKQFWDGKGKLKIVTHHWSNHYKKGHQIYLKLDRILGLMGLGETIEFTYIGRTPDFRKEYAGGYKNTKILAPLYGQALAEELKKHHVYITASENEPAGMHHIEGALCGLPILYLNSGALPEYCTDYGLAFEEHNLPEKIREMKERYEEFKTKILSYDRTAEKMAKEYLNLFELLYDNFDPYLTGGRSPLLVKLYSIYYNLKFALK